MTHIMRIDEMINQTPKKGYELKDEFINGLVELIKNKDVFYNDVAEEMADDIYTNLYSILPINQKPHSYAFVRKPIEKIVEPYNGSTEEDFNHIVDEISLYVWNFWC